MNIKRLITAGILLLTASCLASSCTSGPSQQSEAMKRACADVQQIRRLVISPPKVSFNTAASFLAARAFPQDLKNSGNALIARLPSQLQSDRGSSSRTLTALNEAAAQC